MKSLLNHSELLAGGLLFCALFGSAFLHAPAEDALLGAIPHQARSVQQADSLEDLFASPVNHEIGQAFHGGTLDSILETSAWPRWAVPAEVAVAALPSAYGETNGIWTTVSWLGWRSPWLRWRLEFDSSDSLTFLGKHAVWPVWTLDHPDLKEGMHLSIALTDTLLITCVSRHPADIVWMLDTYDRKNPSKQSNPSEHP